MYRTYTQNELGATGLKREVNSENLFLELSPYESDNKNLIGINPVRISRNALISLGHPTSPIKAIRANCLDCCGGSEAEVRKCTITSCSLWPLRMGVNVFHAKFSGGV